MSTETSRAVVQQFLDHAAEGDIDACFALFSDDASWSNIGSTRLSGTVTGKEAILNDLVGPLFGSLQDGIRSDIEALIADGDRVVVLSQGHATTHDGTPYNNTYAQVFTVRDGQIVAVKEYMDTALIDAVFGTA